MVRVLLRTVVVAFIAPACGRIAGLGDVTPAGDAQPSDASAADAAIDVPTDVLPDVPACSGMLRMPDNEGEAFHRNEVPLMWNANPPISCPCYDDWAEWERTYTEPIPRGYLAHNLSHGGIVLAYNCADCQADIDRLTAIMSSAVDAFCAAAGEGEVRVLVTADPQLPAGVVFAATAWNHSYTASCLNEDEIRSFITAHIGGGPEPEVCEDGDYPFPNPPSRRGSAAMLGTRNR